MAAPVYVYNITISQRRDLCRILDSIVDQPWKLLAEKIGLSNDEIDQLGRAYLRPGGSPTEDLLSQWEVRNPTRDQLVAYLDELGLARAANVVRPNE